MLSALWRGKVVIAAAAVVLGLLGYYASLAQAEKYEATSTVILSSTQPFDALGQYQNPNPAGWVADQMALMRSATLLEAASPAAGVPATDLAEDLDLRASSDGSIITVTATGSTAAEAAAEANAVVAAYQAYSAARVQDAATAARNAVTQQAAVNDDARAQQGQALADISTREGQYGDGVELVDEAVPPAAPSSPVPLRDGLIAAVVGALVAAGVVLWRRGSRPLDTRALLRESGVPVLGSLQVGGSRGAAPAVDVDAATAPLLALQFLSSERVPGPVLVSDLRPGSGSADVVVALATAAARQGSTVVAVSIDEDPAPLLSRLGVATAPPALTGAGDVDPGHLAVVGRLVDAGGRVVGHAARLSARLTRGGDLAAVLAALGRSHDVVLLHGRAIAQSAATYAVVRDCASLVVVVSSEDSQDEVTQAWTAMADRLGVADRTVDGAVVTQRRRAVLRGSGSSGGSATPVATGPAPRPAPQAPGAPGAPGAPSTLPDRPARTAATSPSDR
ncbi:hypothetical protein [Quadrisphaera sp. KR29]|uniref:hypothetical protein n=1 Tax=Quadrisphaera sp. KR29 TaxID=3461391 RepID=UPI004044FA6C